MGKPCSTIWKKKEKKESCWGVIKAGGGRLACVPRLAGPGKAAASQTSFQLDRSQISHPKTSLQVKEISATESHKPGSHVALGQAGFQLLVCLSSRTRQGYQGHAREKAGRVPGETPNLCPPIPFLCWSFPILAKAYPCSPTLQSSCHSTEQRLLCWLAT